MVVSIGSILLQWQAAGIFDYLLPFLLIFALVFAMLQKSKIFGEQKAMHIIIALVIGFLALQLDFVPLLFQQLFPRLGVGLAVLLILLILVGMFIKLDNENMKWPNYVLMAIGVVIFLVIIFQAFDWVGWIGGYGYGSEIVGWIIGGVLLIGIIIAVAISSNDSGSPKAKSGG